MNAIFFLNHHYAHTDDEEVDINARFQMLSFISNDNGPDGIIYAAAAGDATTLGQQLDKFPDEVLINELKVLEVCRICSITNLKFPCQATSEKPLDGKMFPILSAWPWF